MSSTISSLEAFWATFFSLTIKVIFAFKGILSEYEPFGAFAKRLRAKISSSILLFFRESSRRFDISFLNELISSFVFFLRASVSITSRGRPYVSTSLNIFSPLRALPFALLRLSFKIGIAAESVCLNLSSSSFTMRLISSLLLVSSG